MVGERGEHAVRASDLASRLERSISRVARSASRTSRSASRISSSASRMASSISRCSCISMRASCMPSAPQQAARLAASYDQYRRARRDHKLAGTQVRLTPEERVLVSRHVWSASPPKEPTVDCETALSDAKVSGLRIECLSTEPRNTLAERMEVSQSRQAEGNR